jgi:phage terminase large subunit GpA-like protein
MTTETTFGIPYAFESKDDRGVYVECPVCGEHCYLKTRKDAESFTGDTYQAHYAKAHHA